VTDEYVPGVPTFGKLPGVRAVKVAASVAFLVTPPCTTGISSVPEITPEAGRFVILDMLYL
jgi:hypothetical protein